MTTQTATGFKLQAIEKVEGEARLQIHACGAAPQDVTVEIAPSHPQSNSGPIATANCTVCGYSELVEYID